MIYTGNDRKGVKCVKANMESWEKGNNFDASSYVSDVNLCAVVDFDKTDTKDIHCRPVGPYTAGNVHPLVQRVASGEVDKVDEGVHVVHLPDHLLVTGLVLSSRSAHRKGDFGAGIGEREANGFWGGNDAEGFWFIGGLEPEKLTQANVVGLSQVLHRVDLWRKRSIYARGTSPKEGSKHTFASIIPGLEPVEGADGNRGEIGKECRATDESGDGIGHDFVAPSMPDTTDALDGVVETPGENHDSIGMGTRGFDPAEETLRDLTLFGLVIWSERNAGFDAERNVPG